MTESAISSAVDCRGRLRERISNRVAEASLERNDGDANDERDDERVLDHALCLLGQITCLQLVDDLDHNKYLL